ncbi:phage major capsid protein, partial [Candidatus Kaiserbacteria bacterium]|nr:phage major capsid protein [Candidatus Kaiserbacteria bacterium]
MKDFALQHGITDIDTLFPDAKALNSMPEFDKRRTEWVQVLLGAVSKTPFARVKTLSADLTLDEARAKGYVTGALKKEEFFGVQKRTTSATTIYKKQKLDRDDMIDITDFDVVAWLKGEMRLMLEEELARAILLGDGREADHEDKIADGTNGVGIRPVVTDHDLYATKVGVDFVTGSPTESEQGQILIDAVIRNRRHYKGSGQPTFFTSESVISR